MHILLPADQCRLQERHDRVGKRCRLIFELECGCLASERVDLLPRPLPQCRSDLSGRCLARVPAGECLGEGNEAGGKPGKHVLRVEPADELRHPDVEQCQKPLLAVSVQQPDYPCGGLGVDSVDILRAINGEEDVNFHFRQHSARPLAIQVVLRAPEPFAALWRVETLQVPVGGTASVTLEATAGRLGEHAWPAPLLRTAGVLQLAWWQGRLSLAYTARVVPHTLTREEQVLGDRGLGAQPSRAVGSGAEVLQLRDYRLGDSLRSIDWEATARRGQLVSRDFSQETHLTIVLAIDSGRASGLGAGEVDRLGLYVNVAARFAQRVVSQGDAVGLVLFAAQPLAVLPPARGESAVYRLREVLTACRVQPSESNPVLAATRIRGMVLQRSLVLFLTDLEDASAGEQLVKAVRLLKPKHLPFIAAFQSERIEGLVRAPAWDPLGGYRSLAALEYESTTQANVRALRSLGAAALTARPAELDGAVLSAYQQLRLQRRI